MARKRTIKLKKYVDIINEFIAGEDVKPGHLLKIASTGKVVKHDVAGGNVLPLFVLEQELFGKGIDYTILATDPVQVWTACRGEEVFAILKNGENVAIGDALESAGNGELQKHVADSTGDFLGNAIVGYALEAVDMSGSSGVDPDGYIKIVIA